MHVPSSSGTTAGGGRTFVGKSGDFALLHLEMVGHIV